MINVKRSLLFGRDAVVRKPDEMQRHILARAQRNAYLFLVVSLVIWTFCESGRVYRYHTALNPVPCALLAGAMLVQTFSQLLLTRRAVKDDEDSFERGPLVGLILLVCVVAGVAATAAAAVLLMGVPQ